MAINRKIKTPSKPFIKNKQQAAQALHEVDSKAAWQSVFQLTPERKLLCVITIALTGFLGALGWHYYLVAFHNVPYPLNTFLFNPGDRFNDYYNYVKDAMDAYKTPASNRTTMPLPMFLFQVVAENFNSDYVLILESVVFMMGSIWFVAHFLPYADKFLNRVLAMSLVCFSYPFLFCIDRSNLECPVFLALAAFVWFYVEGKTAWAVMCLGLAMALKPYVLFLLPVFIADRKLWAGVQVVGVTFALSLVSLLLLGGDIFSSLNVLGASGTQYNDSYVIGNEGLYFGSSLFGFCKLMAASYTQDGILGVDCRSLPWSLHFPPASHWFTFASTHDWQAFLQRMTHYYFFFSIVVFVLVTACLWVWRVDLWKRVAVLICCMNLLPYVCGDYRIMHFFLPLALFLQEKNRSRLDLLYVGIFGLLLIPKSYFHFAYAPVFQIRNLEVSEAVYMNPLLMVLLMTLILTSAIVGRSWSQDALTLAARLGWRPRS